MDAALIQAKINFGYSKVAQYLGVECNWYRPTPTTFIDPTTLQGTLLSTFDPKPNFGFAVPSTFAHPQWYVGADRTNLLAGDYLVDPSGNTYFINILEPLTPTGAILCNAVVQIYRPGTDQTFGNGYYGGNPSGTGTPLIANCPCSILQGTKGEADKSGVIAEGRQPWVSIVLPITGVILEVADILIDNQGRRYELSSIETTTIGVRITADFAGA